MKNFEYVCENGEYVKIWEEDGKYWVKAMRLDCDGDFVKIKTAYMYDSYAWNRFYQELGKLYFKRLKEMIK